MIQAEENGAADAESQVLDLSSMQLPSLEGICLPPSLQTVLLTANRLTALDASLLNLTGLLSLCLRQNLLSNISGLSALKAASGLQSLSVYDNQIVQVPDLHSFTSLTHLDLSYNHLTSLTELKCLAQGQLQELYASSNSLSSTKGLSGLQSLTLLELGCNRLRDTDEIQQLTGLQELWLGSNRISASPPFGRWKRLRKLSLQSNRLKQIAGLEECALLEELWLSHNGLSSIQGLHQLTALSALDVTSNQLTHLEGLSALAGLQDLWADINQLSDWPLLASAMQPLRNGLTCLSLAENPVCRAFPSSYEAQIRHLLPALKELDGKQLDDRHN
ncbi:hypothetical protein WJX73_007047 [Symbiochloris irregularis]|uniref:Uncharacterized protein n=1 Tax=Symbiochloris irregularis TaxID=706552 RepID=A0AAW1P214_9CHLO